MLNESHIGHRVISDFFGTGTIIQFDTGKFPIGVIFDSLNTNNVRSDKLLSDAYYTVSGKCCIGLDSYNITLINTKIGSPDARKIVAMLARKWRAAKSETYSTQDIYLRNLYAHEDMYYDAKQLLEKQ